MRHYRLPRNEFRDGERKRGRALPRDSTCMPINGGDYNGQIRRRTDGEYLRPIESRREEGEGGGRECAGIIEFCLNKATDIT